MTTLFRIGVSVAFYAGFFAFGALFFAGAVALYLFVTLPFDRNGRVQHLYSCLWGCCCFYLNPLWSLEVEGRERIPRGRRLVLVANHESMADIIALCGLYVPFKWVSKASVARIPLIGWNMVLNRYVLLERGNKDSIAQMMSECEDWLRREMPVMIFPEGTRSADGGVLPFKDGAFRLAIRTGSPVVPMVIVGTREILPKHGFLVSTDVQARLVVLDPVDPAPFGNDVAALREHVRSLIVREKQRQLADQPPPLDAAA